MTKSMRAGEDIMAATHIPTASTNRSHARHAPLPWRVFTESFPDGQLFVDVVVVSSLDTVCEFTDTLTARNLVNAEFIVRAVNHHEALLAALKEVSFRLATLIAASGDFTDINAKALDAATAAITNAEEQ